jgi:hypothetical protein
MLYEHGVMVMPLSTRFPLYRGSQFIWWRKPEYPANTTDLPIMLYQVHLALVGFELTMLVVIGTDCICSYKSNYQFHVHVSPDLISCSADTQVKLLMNM